MTRETVARVPARARVSDEGCPLTVPFDTVFGYAAGSAIALVARRPLARTFDPVRSRYFATAALFGGAVFAPCGLTFYALYPDWSLMYLANPAHLPAFLVLPFLLVLYAGAPLAGFLVTHRLILTQRTRELRLSMLIVVALLLAIVIFARQRLFTVAYYDAFHAGTETIPLLASRLRVALPIGSLAVVGALAFALVTVHRHVDACESFPSTAKAPERSAQSSVGPEVSLPSVERKAPAASDA